MHMPSRDYLLFVSKFNKPRMKKNYCDLVPPIQVFRSFFEKLVSVDAGEKMGLQITVLLADIIYVEVLQSTIPVFDSLGTDIRFLSY